MREARLGDILYRQGDVGAPFCILIAATLEIVQQTVDGERLITTLRPGMFTGEAGMIAGQPSIVLARVIEEGQILELRPEDLRVLLSRDVRLGEIFLRALFYEGSCLSPDSWAMSF